LFAQRVAVWKIDHPTLNFSYFSLLLPCPFLGGASSDLGLSLVPPAMQPEAWAHVQRVHLGNNIFLNLHKPTFPGSWSVSREQSTKELPFGTEGFLTTLQNATERVVSAASSTPDAKAHLFIDVGFDQLGRCLNSLNLVREIGYPKT